MPNIRWTPELYRRRIPNSLLPIEPFQGIGIRIDHQCRVCRTVLNRLPRDVLESQQRDGCSHCNGNRAKTPEEYDIELKQRKLPFRAVEPYKASVVPSLHQCLRCQHKWNVRPNLLLSGQNCPSCGPKRRKTKVKGRTFTVGSAVEEEALHWILNHTSFKARQLQTSELPAFFYTYRSKQHVYHPDIAVGKTIIVEVKSTYTAGLHDRFFHMPGWTIWKKLRAKAQAVLNEGYKFRLLLYHQWGRGENLKLRLPKDWLSLSQTAMRSELVRLNPKIGVRLGWKV